MCAYCSIYIYKNIFDLLCLAVFLSFRFYLLCSLFSLMFLSLSIVPVRVTLSPEITEALMNHPSSLPAAMRFRLLKHTRLNVVAFINELPKTQHDTASFNVDVNTYTVSPSSTTKHYQGVGWNEFEQLWWTHECSTFFLWMAGPASAVANHRGPACQCWYTGICVA